jgi:hypothetical protein
MSRHDDVSCKKTATKLVISAYEPESILFGSDMRVGAWAWRNDLTMDEAILKLMDGLFLPRMSMRDVSRAL